MDLVQIIKRDIIEPREFDKDFEWMKEASCVGLTDIFFPGRGETSKVRLAVRICEECPVKPQCVDYALRNTEIIGIWGGLSERQRRRLRREIRNESRN